jgi:hypothetical protein
MASFNGMGGTLHIFVGLDWRNMKKGMTNSTMEKLQNKLQNNVAILMDEMSMLSQIILGLVEHVVARSSIGNGGATDIPQLNKNGDMKGLHDGLHMWQCQEQQQLGTWDT